RCDGPQSVPPSWIMVRRASHEFVGFAGLCASRVWLMVRRPPHQTKREREKKTKISRKDLPSGLPKNKREPEARTHFVASGFNPRSTVINNNMRSIGSTHNKGYVLLGRQQEPERPIQLHHGPQSVP